MEPAAWVFAFGVGVVALYGLMISRLFTPKVHTGDAAPSKGENTGGTMDTIARWVVLGLGKLTFGALHLFEKLGVEVATIDETLASWTNWSNDIKAKLKDALDDAQNLRDTDAAEDAVEANALSEALAKKVQDAFDAVSTVPTIPGTTDPVTEPEAPVDETPVVPDPDEPTTPPEPFDPGPVSTPEAEESVATDEPTAQ